MVFGIILIWKSRFSVRDVPRGKGGELFTASRTHSTSELWAALPSSEDRQWHTWGCTRACGHCVHIPAVPPRFGSGSFTACSKLRAVHTFPSLVQLHFYQHHPTCIPAVAWHSSKTELSAKKSPVVWGFRPWNNFLWWALFISIGREYFAFL